VRWFVGCAIAAAACGGAETTSPPTTAPITAAALRPDTNGGPPVIAPNRLEPLRIAGELTITPDDDVKLAAKQTGQELHGSFKFCLDETGHLTGVTMLQTTHVESYDAKIVAAMQRWAYRPVMVDGHAIAVCSAITFIFKAR